MTTIQQIKRITARGFNPDFDKPISEVVTKNRSVLQLAINSDKKRQ